MALRVLHIGKYFPPYRGGMEVFLADLMEEQRKRGIDAHALVHGDPEPDDPPWLQRVPVQFSLVYAPMAIGFRKALGDAIERLRPDVLHLHLPNNSALWALTLPVARRVPWVIHWQSDVVFSDIKWSVALAYMLYKPFEQALLERTDQIIATSPPYLEASKALRSWHNKTNVIPLGININATPPLVELPAKLQWRKGTQLKLLSIGRLTYYKGFETLIEAVSTMPDVELLIVGEGELREALEAKIEENSRPGKPASVRLLGAVTDSEKHTLLAQCDVFCLASCERTEAFGIVVLEAMMHARPCIVTDLPGSGMPWIVAQSRSGLRVPYEDVDAWRSHIARMQFDPQLRQRFGVAGVDAIQKMFSIGPCERAIARHYRGLAPESTAVEVNKRLMIVIYARNMEANLRTLMQSVREIFPQCRIVVVDNRSVDATVYSAELGGATVLRPLLGVTNWGAIQTGLRYAQAHGHESVLTIDAAINCDLNDLSGIIKEANRFPITDIFMTYCKTENYKWRKFGSKISSLFKSKNSYNHVQGLCFYRKNAIIAATSPEATLIDYDDLGINLLIEKFNLQKGEFKCSTAFRKSAIPTHSKAQSLDIKRIMAAFILFLAHARKRH